ncbi:nitric oxide synthase oxygenase [Paenibacillus sp. CAU 1782]
MSHTSGDNPLIKEAAAFIEKCYGELRKSSLETEQRIQAIQTEIRNSGTYRHTAEELEHGARMAWRNSNRCIGRLFWESLSVTDARHVETTGQMAEALLQHIASATNGGTIRPFITIFSAADLDGRGPRIWNHQLIRYAGYERNGTIVGDPASLDFTKTCMDLGWQGEGTPFDVLPLVINASGEKPQLFPLPQSIVKEVPIEHPQYTAIAELGIKWYAVPIVSDMRLEIGGISYPAAPFNGWYMGTEIGARNLTDEARYNLLPAIAEKLGLDTARDFTLWKDKALVELNIAVLHSYRKHGVSIVDHHTAAQQFARFQKNEADRGREITGRWSWLIPPMSPAATSIFHTGFNDEELTPNFFKS